MAVENLITALLLPLLRNVTGWIENSLQDGKIQKYEWKQLGTTLVKLGIPVVFAYAGVELANLDHVITMITAFVVVFIDWLYGKYGKAEPKAE